MLFNQNKLLLKSIMDVQERERKKVKSLNKKIRCFKTGKLPKNMNRRRVCKRLFKCYQCQKDFLSKFHLVRHQRTHTGEKPFKCTLCFRMFGTKYHLTRHTEIHMRQFKCSQCTQTYSKRHLLLKHISKKHFKCPRCPRMFTD